MIRRKILNLVYPVFKLSYTFALKVTELFTFPVFMRAKCFSEREKHVLTHNVFLTLTREL